VAKKTYTNRCKGGKHPRWHTVDGVTTCDVCGFQLGQQAPMRPADLEPRASYAESIRAAEAAQTLKGVWPACRVHEGVPLFWHPAGWRCTECETARLATPQPFELVSHGNRAASIFPAERAQPADQRARATRRARAEHQWQRSTLSNTDQRR
jgi:hypothetical protein